MKANELRIGNLLNVKYTKQIKEDFITEIKGYDIVRIEENDFNTLYYEPIIINEEWLKKFGFVRIFEISNLYLNFTNDIYLALSDDKLIGLVRNNYMNSDSQVAELEFEVNIKYVHQLQNLFFALTNEELTIKQQ